MKSNTISGGEGVVGSNPAIPTILNAWRNIIFLILSLNGCEIFCVLLRMPLNDKIIKKLKDLAFNLGKFDLYQSFPFL